MHAFTDSPPNHVGFFSPQTSESNFCEIDYEVTIYIAEFINTLTNFAYVYLSITALTPKSSSRNIFSWPMMNISLLLVGIGSAAFHATLKHYAQMADELSMYAIITTLNYRVYTFELFSSPQAKALVAGILTLSTAVVAYSNITSADGSSTALHLVLFVTLVTTFWPRVLVLINRSSSRPEAADSASKGMTVAAYEEVTKRRRLSTFRNGGLALVFGFGLWLIDGLFCHQLRAVRAYIGLPFAWVLEFHGAWHILTAMAAGIFVRLVEDLTGEGAA